MKKPALRDAGLRFGLLAYAEGMLKKLLMVEA
jgi:hypothetical protein